MSGWAPNTKCYLPPLYCGGGSQLRDLLHKRKHIKPKIHAWFNNSRVKAKFCFFSHLDESILYLAKESSTFIPPDTVRMRAVIAITITKSVGHELPLTVEHYSTARIKSYSEPMPPPLLRTHTHTHTHTPPSSL